MNKIDIFTNNQHAEILADQLSLLEAISVTWQDAKNSPIYEPDPGEFILWPDVILSAYFLEWDDMQPALNFLMDQKRQGTLQHFVTVEVPQTDWVRQSLDQFKPQLFGHKLWIYPSWEAVPERAPFSIMLDPGLAFGTGSHPTTRLCLEWLAVNINGKERVVDYGAGSGILGLAALKLGAEFVYFIDHDPQALTAVRENLIKNQIDDSRYYLAESLPKEALASLVIANILAKPLINLSLIFKECLLSHGQIVLSGILLDQCDEVSQAYEWCHFAPSQVLDQWALLAGIKK